MPAITAKTKLLCLIGDPVNESLSPLIQNHALKHYGIDARYLAFNIDSDSLPQAITGLKTLKPLGINITIPHKEEIIPLLDGLSPEAAGIAAVNTITVDKGKFIGHNTDGIALLQALSGKNYKPRGTHTFCMGAGGAARACLFALAQAGTGRVTIYNRDQEKSRRLLQHLTVHFPGLKTKIYCPRSESWQTGLINALKIEKPDLLLNATPLRRWPLNIPLNSTQVVCDLVYVPYPGVTTLLELALQARIQIITGLSILVHQGAQAFSLWTEHSPPLDLMWQALLGNKGGKPDVS